MGVETGKQRGDVAQSEGKNRFGGYEKDWNWDWEAASPLGLLVQVKLRVLREPPWLPVVVKAPSPFPWLSTSSNRDAYLYCSSVFLSVGSK